MKEKSSNAEAPSLSLKHRDILTRSGFYPAHRGSNDCMDNVVRRSFHSPAMPASRMPSCHGDLRQSPGLE